MTETPFDDRIAKGQVVTGDAAVEQARAWGLKMTNVVAARRSGHLGCRTADDAAGFRECATCRSVMGPLQDEDDE